MSDEWKRVFDGHKCSFNSAFAPLAKIRQMGSGYCGLLPHLSSFPSSLKVSGGAIREAELGRAHPGTSPQRFSASFLLEGRQILRCGRVAGPYTHLFICSW